MYTSFKRTIRYGWRNFRRQGSFSFAGVFIMVVTISLITSLFLFQAGIDSVFSYISKKVDISVYFAQESPEEEIFRLKDELTKIPEVAEVEYVSKEEALSRFVERHQDEPLIIESLSEVGGNPLLASLNVRARDFSEYAGISEFLSNGSFGSIIAKIDYSQRKPLIERLYSLTSEINRAGVVVSLLFALIAVLITFNQIRLAIQNSGEEIKIMRLVGASNWTIQGPFMVQAIIAGLVAVLLVIILSVPLFWFAGPKLEAVAPDFNLFHYYLANFFLISGIQLSLGMGIGIFSSLIAIRKYLKA